MQGAATRSTPRARASRPMASPTRSSNSGEKVAARAMGTGKQVHRPVVMPRGPSLKSKPLSPTRGTPAAGTALRSPGGGGLQDEGVEVLAAGEHPQLLVQGELVAQRAGPLLELRGDDGQFGAPSVRPPFCRVPRIAPIGALLQDATAKIVSLAHGHQWGDGGLERLERLERDRW